MHWLPRETHFLTNAALFHHLCPQGAEIPLRCEASKMNHLLQACHTAAISSHTLLLFGNVKTHTQLLFFDEVSRTFEGIHVRSGNTQHSVGCIAFVRSPFLSCSIHMFTVQCSRAAVKRLAHPVNRLVLLIWGCCTCAAERESWVKRSPANHENKLRSWSHPDFRVAAADQCALRARGYMEFGASA